MWRPFTFFYWREKKHPVRNERRRSICERTHSLVNVQGPARPSSAHIKSNKPSSLLCFQLCSQRRRNLPSVPGRTFSLPYVTISCLNRRSPNSTKPMNPSPAVSFTVFILHKIYSSLVLASDDNHYNHNIIIIITITQQVIVDDLGSSFCQVRHTSLLLKLSGLIILQEC